MTSFTENSSVEDLGVAWSMLPAEPWENTCSGMSVRALPLSTACPMLKGEGVGQPAGLIQGARLETAGEER